MTSPRRVPAKCSSVRFVPGLVLVVLYMAFILIIALVRPGVAPAVPYDGKYDRQFAGKVVLILVPPLALIFLVLGSIISGIATVNQAGAIGAIGAMIMAGYRLKEGSRGAYTPSIVAMLALLGLGVVLSFYDINVKRIETAEDVNGLIMAVIAVTLLLFAIFWSGWRALTIGETLRGVMLETAKTTSLVFIILLGAAMLTAAFRAFGGEELVKHFLQGLPGGFWSQFVIVMLVIFVLGFFLDFIEIAVVVVPIVAPILLADPSANVTAVWLGVMIGLNIQTSFLTPPFGFALFYLRGVAPPTVKTIEMYRGVIAFIGLQLLALGIVGVTPALVNYLPNRTSLLSETAPPPINPRLQVCVEEYLFDHFASNRTGLEKVIADARALDASALPKSMARKLEGGLKKAEGTFALVDEVRTAERAVNELSAAYAPLHRKVREIQRDIRRAEAEIKELDESKRRAQRRGGSVADLEQKMAAFQVEVEALKTQIPDNWEAESAAFKKLRKADLDARRKYRRNVDDAYDSVEEIISVLRATDELAGHVEAVDGLAGPLATLAPKKASENFKEVAQAIGRVAGARKLRSSLNKVRRELRARKPDLEKANKAYEKVREQLRDEVAWRKAAAAKLLAGLERYNEATRDNIGLRQQARLPRDIALYVASCNSDHRNLELYF